MPSCAWASSSRTRSWPPWTRSSDHDAAAALKVIQDDRRINEAQFHLSSLIATVIATQQPVARDLRFLLSLDHVTYELERMGDHAASVAKQARKLAPYPPPGRIQRAPGDGPPDRVAGPRDPGRPGRCRRGRGAGRSPPVTTRWTSSITGPSSRPLGLMRADPANVDPGDADPVRGPLSRADRRSGDEHRRGHRVPGDRRDRRPQFWDESGPSTRKTGSSRRAVMTPPARRRSPGRRQASPRRA